MAHISQPKSLALMFLLGAFLTGGAVGFAADRVVGAKKPVTRAYTIKQSRDELARELTLDDRQRVLVDSILDWRNNRDREITRSVRPLREANRDSARVLILQHLDSTQQTKFWEIIERMRPKGDKDQKDKTQQHER